MFPTTYLTQRKGEVQMKHSALIVTKDIGGFRVTRPLADALKDDGWKVTVIAEGKSLSLWHETKHTVSSGGMLAQQLSVEQAVTMLRDERPNVVIATLGSPINLEDAFSHAANELGIPLVWFPDVWGAEVRSSAQPTAILAFDNTTQLLLNKQSRFGNTQIKIVGHPLANEMLAQPSAEAQTAIAGLKQSGKTIILIAGQGEYTSDMIDFVCKSIAHSDGSFIVVPRFHPKYMGSKPEWIAKWNERLATLPEGTVVNIDTSVKTDHIAMLADITVSSFSTTLTYAALARKIPISVSTPKAREAMVRSTGLSYYPPTQVGAAIESESSLSLSLAALHEKLPGQQDFFIPPFSVSTALRAIAYLVL